MPPRDDDLAGDVWAMVVAVARAVGPLLAVALFAVVAVTVAEWTARGGW